MNIEQIKEILSSYEKLKDLAYDKLRILKSFDFEKYYTGNGVDELSIDDTTVYVRFEEYQNSYDSFTFPTSWLCLSDDELAKIVTEEKSLRLQKEADKVSKIEKDKEAKEFAEYQKLKAKFEN